MRSCALLSFVRATGAVEAAQSCACNRCILTPCVACCITRCACLQSRTATGGQSVGAHHHHCIACAPQSAAQHPFHPLQLLCHLEIHQVWFAICGLCIHVYLKSGCSRLESFVISRAARACRCMRSAALLQWQWRVLRVSLSELAAVWRFAADC